MSGSHRIPAPPHRVWDALNDPDVLKASIRGCEMLERTEENRFMATVVAKVGPIKAKFQGDIMLTDIDPPLGYTLVGEGRGGVAGFAKGKAVVSLAECEGETVLRYQVEAVMAGKLAQLGSRFVAGIAKKEADFFFTAFTRLVADNDIAVGDGSRTVVDG